MSIFQNSVQICNPMFELSKTKHHCRLCDYYNVIDKHTFSTVLYKTLFFKLWKCSGKLNECDRDIVNWIVRKGVEIIRRRILIPSELCKEILHYGSNCVDKYSNATNLQFSLAFILWNLSVSQTVWCHTVGWLVNNVLEGSNCGLNQGT